MNIQAKKPPIRQAIIRFLIRDDFEGSMGEIGKSIICTTGVLSFSENSAISFCSTTFTKAAPSI